MTEILSPAQDTINAKTASLMTETITLKTERAAVLRALGLEAEQHTVTDAIAVIEALVQFFEAHAS